MRAARLTKSARLKRALRALQADGGWMSTRELIRRARICAVNSVIAELRENGCDIETKQDTDDKGERRWRYRLKKAPEGWNA